MKKRRNQRGILLTDPAFGEMWETETEKNLRRRYMQLWHHAETARADLVTKYDPFVTSQAKKYDWTKLPLSDRISLGKEGLLRASQKYDPSSDNHFATYAKHWIRAMISNEWKRTNPIRVTSNMWEKIFKIQKAIHEIRKEDEDIGTEELYAQITERTGIERKTIETALKAMANHNSVVSLDEKAYGESGAKGRNERRLHDMIVDESAAEVDVEAIEKVRGERLRDAIKKLPERQIKVLEERYWGDSGGGKTLSEVATGFGISRERIRQIEGDAFNNLRREFEEEAIISSSEREEEKIAPNPGREVSVEYLRQKIPKNSVQARGEKEKF